MGKIMQSAVVLLLATNVFAHKPSAHSHRVKTAKKAQSVAHKEAAIPSQSGMWINSGGGVCCLYARNIDRTGKQDAMLNILSVGTGAQIRYQRNSCIYSMGFLASWAPVLVTAVDKNQTPTKYATGYNCKNVMMFYELSIGHQFKRHSLFVYIGTNMMYHATGAQYSYLLGKNWLLQAKLGAAFMRQAVRKLASLNMRCVPGLDVSINVAYRYF